MERVFGAVEHRVLGCLWPFAVVLPAQSLDFGGRPGWSAWRERHIFFYIVPKAFLPVGDSSFIRGVMVAQEGSSPAQMHAYQTQAEKIMQANPAVRSTFTMSGNATFSARIRSC